MDNTHNKQMYDQCKKHMHAYVLAEMQDGTTFDGIITGLDREYVYFAVPNDSYKAMTMPAHDSGHDYRQYGYDSPGFGYGYGGPEYGFPGYGYGPGFGYGRPRPFRRLVLPLALLTAITLLPWY